MKNVFNKQEDEIHILLTQEKIAVIDSKNIHKIEKYRWVAEKSRKGCYAIGYINGKMKRMHNLILAPKPGYQIDHIDRNGLNNTERNLRYATHTQNMINRGIAKNNTSGTSGVHFCNRSKRWIARIKVDGKHIYIGRGKNFEDVEKLRKSAVKKYYGEYAPIGG